MLFGESKQWRKSLRKWRKIGELNETCEAQGKEKGKTGGNGVYESRITNHERHIVDGWLIFAAL